MAPTGGARAWSRELALRGPEEARAVASASDGGGRASARRTDTFPGAPRFPGVFLHAVDVAFERAEGGRRPRILRLPVGTGAKQLRQIGRQDFADRDVDRAVLAGNRDAERVALKDAALGHEVFRRWVQVVEPAFWPLTTCRGSFRLDRDLGGQLDESSRPRPPSPSERVIVASRGLARRPSISGRPR